MLFRSWVFGDGDDDQLKAMMQAVQPFIDTAISKTVNVPADCPYDDFKDLYLQAWHADNLFVMGASVFPQNASYNPTGLVGALAYWSAEAITKRYIKNPGPLVPV